jgi:hypothetical protein
MKWLDALSHKSATVHWADRFAAGTAGYRRHGLFQHADYRARQREANPSGVELPMPEAAVCESWAEASDVGGIAARFGVWARATQWRRSSFELEERR